jgi:hypothetical protein
MRQGFGRGTGFVAILLTTLGFSLAASAPAHVRTVSGPYRIELGWADEPAYSGVRNAVDVGIEDAAGDPVADSHGSLRVEVSFGSTRRTLALTPAGQPGRYVAAIVPTRPGSYAFHVMGVLRGRAVDVAATCSDETFECVQGAAAIEFPAAEPSGADLDRKLERDLARAAAGEHDADRARTLAIGALVLAAIALAAIAGVTLRRR